MDVFSHFAIPFLLVWLVRRRRDEALAAGVGGFAPDLDSVTSVLALWDPLYFLGHRGASHSLLGAPLFALGAVLLLRAPFWTRVLPIARDVRFGPRLALVAMLASYTHLALDATTMWGVPLLFPDATRFTSGWFFYSVLPMVPFSAYLVWRIARGTATSRTLRIVGALLLAALVVSGATRAITRPVTDADVTMPAAGEWAWTTLEREGDTWNATFWSFGRVVGNASYVGKAPTAGQHPALDAALASAEFRAFRLYAGGPIVAQVDTQMDGSGANVTFLDLMERTQLDRTTWLPFGADTGVLRLRVDGGEVEEIKD